MGAQLKCNLNSYQKSDFSQQIKKQKSIKTFSQNIDHMQEYDNPSRQKLCNILNKRTLIASNNLLILQNKNKDKDKDRKSSTDGQKQQTDKILNKHKLLTDTRIRPQTQITSIQYQIATIISSQLSNQLQQTDNIVHNQSNILQLILNKQSDPINQLKSYILSSKSLYQSYQKIQINHHDFIKFIKQPINNFYKIQTKIGQGSFGKVYKGICIKTNQIRAIKSIKQKIMSQQKKKQLMIEIDTLIVLDHPNIIKLFQIYEQKNMIHVVTQYCVGGSIVQLMMKRQKYNQKIVKNIIKQILSALIYMHKLKIVHRDLKLQNIVMLNHVNDESQQQNFNIKIIDFGTATKINKKVNLLTHLVGTNSYMAPQIINKYFNQNCDIWSTGIIFYILLVGRSPFKCIKKQDTLDKIQQYELKFQDTQFKYISKQAVDLLKKMLIKDPQKRISAAEALDQFWFKQSKSGYNLFYQNKNLVKNLQKYYRGNNFISKIQSYLTYIKVNQQQRKKISQQFVALDINHDGNIQINQLKTVYKKIYPQQYSQYTQQIQYIISKVDKNKSGKIDLQQFTAAVYDKKKLFCREYLLEAFQYFDTDHTGFIQTDQLKTLLLGCQKQQIQQILSDVDLNRDSKISKDQFLNYMQRMNLIFIKKIKPSIKK